MRAGRVELKAELARRGLGGLGALALLVLQRWWLRSAGPWGSRPHWTRSGAEGAATVKYGDQVAGINAPAVESKIVQRMPDGSGLACMCIQEGGRLTFNRQPPVMEGSWLGTSML